MFQSIRTFLLIAAVVFVASCKREEPGSQLLGRWVTPVENIEFREDGSYLVNNENGKFQGRYSFQQGGDILVFSPDESHTTGRIESRYGFLDENRKLLIENSFSGTLVYVRES